MPFIADTLIRTGSIDTTSNTAVTITKFLVALTASVVHCTFIHIYNKNARLLSHDQIERAHDQIIVTVKLMQTCAGCFIHVEYIALEETGAVEPSINIGTVLFTIVSSLSTLVNICVK